MRVVFVDNLLFEDGQGIRRYILQPHLGLISLISVIEGAGHEGILFDPKVEVSLGRLALDRNLYRDMADKILALRPDAIGFTSLGCNFICTAKTAAHIKAREPDVPILLGGPHATVLDRAILAAFPQFDVIARNEAENTILPILAALPARDFGGVPGVSYVRGGHIVANPGEPQIENLDELPVPAYHTYPVRELGLTTLRVDAGRGCPFQCTFCSTASFFGRSYRLKSAERLCRELDFLHQTYGISDFALTHDLFTVNKKKVLAFCDAVQDRGYAWKCSARQDCVDPELLRRMSEAGCSSIYYGIESGSERMQTISKKRLDLALFDPVLEATQSLGMSATVSFITGYPEETAADQSATLDLIGRSFARDRAPLNVQLHLLTPEPGTELLRQHGDKLSFDGHISDFNFPALESDDESVTAAHPSVFINHHYFPATLPRDLHIFVTTSYQFLYGLGFPLLRYILRRHDGRFSALVHGMSRWRRRTKRPAACTEDMVAAYFAETYGARHHITGLVRYMLAATALRRAAANEPGTAAAQTRKNGALRLTPRAAIALDVPDCAQILDRLQRNPDASLEPGILRKRYDFLLHLARPQADRIENLELDAGGAATLGYFSVPRTWPSKASFEREMSLPPPPDGFIAQLQTRGILIDHCGADAPA